MIPTDEDFKAIRESIEATEGIDDELFARCGQLIRIGDFASAVREAFTVLEERLRSATGKEGMTGVQLANHAFALDAPLAKQLASTPSQREGLRELYSGAFKLFRNPAAHGSVRYTTAEGKSIIGLVNLLLVTLERVPPLFPGQIPPNVEATLGDAEKLLGEAAASRLRAFIGKCIQLRLRPSASREQWIPFRRYALVQKKGWPEARPFQVPVFYIVRGKEPSLWFPVNQYHAEVRGLDVQPIKQSLNTLGFTPTGRNQDYQVVLQSGQDQEFFDELLALVTKLDSELELTLQKKIEKG